MTLSTATKNLLASIAGVNQCFANSGISYLDPDGVSRNGGTADIINAFVVSNLVGKPNVPIKGGYTYTSLKTYNGAVDITIEDVSWAYNTTYCISGTPTPQPTPTLTPQPGTSLQGQPQLFEFISPPTGIPTITLDLSTLEMKQNNSDRHLEMNSVNIKNTSSWPVYIAAEVKIYPGYINNCPVSGAVFNGLNRSEAISRAVRINTIDPGVTDTLNLDFFQPTNLIGFYTICLYIRGSFVKQDLIIQVIVIYSF